MIPFIGPILSIIDKIVPDANERTKLKMQAMQMAADGEFKEEELRYSALVMEAKSADPWTSRARPSFMYVFYIYILTAIPMGFLFAFKPEIADAVIAGVSGWLDAVPPAMWATFTAGYLGYVNKRSADKATIMGVEQPQGLLSKILG